MICNSHNATFELYCTLEYVFKLALEAVIRTSAVACKLVRFEVLYFHVHKWYNVKFLLWNMNHMDLKVTKENHALKSSTKSIPALSNN